MDNIAPSRRFDPIDPSVHIDPYPSYAMLRASGPVCRGPPGQWVVTRHREVVAMLRDPRLQNEFPPEYYRMSMGNGAAAEFLQRILIYRDHPRHTALRRALASAFGAGALQQLRERVEELVEECLEPAMQRGHLDVVAELALPLPLMVICEVIGIPAADRDAVRRRATDLAKTFLFVAAPQDRAIADAAVVWLRGYVGDLAAQRRRIPADDIVSGLLGDDMDESDREDLIDNVIFLLFAGFETTSSLIANGCAALLANDGELQRLKSNLSLMSSAVEEFLRFDAPVQSRFRLVREPVTIGDTTIRPGRLLLLLLGSANRDETRFADPDRLDIARRPNPHVSFGGGEHLCVGAALARIEAAAAFAHLLRCRRVEPNGTAVRSIGSALRTYERIPMTIVPS